MTFAEKYYAWYNTYMVAGFYKSWTFITNALGALIGLVPDLLNLAITNWSMVDGLPTLSPTHKLYLFAGINVLNLLLRGIKQPAVQAKVLQQAEDVGQVVVVPDVLDKAAPK